MLLQTVPIKATETQVLNLMKQTQKAQNPLLLTQEGMLEPTAVLMNLEDYEKLQHYKQSLYQIRLFQLKQRLDQVEQRWEENALRAECIAYWQEHLPDVWDVCPEPARGLCASLTLSIKHLNLKRFSLSQVAALRFCLTLLQSVIPNKQAIDQAYDQLEQSGLPPMLTFDQKFIQSYIDES